MVKTRKRRALPFTVVESHPILWLGPTNFCSRMKFRHRQPSRKVLWGLFELTVLSIPGGAKHVSRPKKSIWATLLRRHTTQSIIPEHKKLKTDWKNGYKLIAHRISARQPVGCLFHLNQIAICLCSFEDRSCQWKLVKPFSLKNNQF